MGKLTADDRLDILELIATYSRCIDEPRFDDLVGLFAPDGALDVGPLGQYQGAAGVTQFVGVLKTIGQMMRHYTTNVIVKGDGGHATAQLYVLALVGPGPGKLNITTGFYEDEFVKLEGRWLFQSRKVMLDYSRA